MVQLFRKRYTSVNEKKYTENYVNEEEDIYEKNTNERYNKRYKIF